MNRKHNKALTPRVRTLKSNKLCPPCRIVPAWRKVHAKKWHAKSSE